MAGERLVSPDVSERLKRPESVLVVGAGPAGLVSAILLNRQEIKVTCIDERDVFSDELEKESGGRCTGCGGLVQKQVFEVLGKHGIDLRELGVVRRTIKAFKVHLPVGDLMNITAPEETVALFRGISPDGSEARGLDRALAEIAREEGVEFIQAKVTRVELEEGEGVRVMAEDKNLGEEREWRVDFMVGAFAHSGLVRKIEVQERFGEPKSQTSAVMELNFGSQFCAETFENKMHVVVIPEQLAEGMKVRFAAFIPKDDGTVTLVLLGRGNIKQRDAYEFLESDFAKALVPEQFQQTLGEAESGKEKEAVLKASSRCQCWGRRITVVPPDEYLTVLPGEKLQGIVLIGDAGPTRPYKNGLWAAILGAINMAEILVKRGDSGTFIDMMTNEFPRDDYKYAHMLMDFNDLWISQKCFRKMLQFLNTYQVPWISQQVDQFTQHLLIGDIAYKGILPEWTFWAIDKFLEWVKKQEEKMA